MTGLIISTVMVLPGEQYIKKKSFHSKFRISDSNIEYLFTKTWIYKKNKNKQNEVNQKVFCNFC